MNVTARISHTFLHEMLLELLYYLRYRNFELGPSDFLLALKALRQEIGTGSREDFVFMCQSLWGKSRDQQEEIEKFLMLIWRDQTGEDGLSGNETDKPGLASMEVPKTDQVSVQNETEQTDLKTGTDKPVEQSVPSLTQSEIEIDFRFGYSNPESEITIPKIQTFKVNLNLDLEGSLPISIRQMKRSWRHYRKMRRTGPPIELDLAATIQQINRHAFLLRPILRPRRVNMAEILVFVDEGGSMVPFRRVVEALSDTAAYSGLSNVLTFYFHDVPRKRIFSDREFVNSHRLEHVLRRGMGKSVLIISDAGAARGNFDENRFRHTINFIELLKKSTKNIAWLNPTPEERWQFTTAGAITKETNVPMFTMKPDSLNDAIDILRGKID